MDINVKNTPFSGSKAFTNEEIESIWKNLQKEKLETIDNISIEIQKKTNMGIKVLINKNGLSEMLEFLYKEYYIYIDGAFPIKIYTLDQINSIISIVNQSDKYELKITRYDPNIENQNSLTNFNKIEINTKKDETLQNFGKYITRETSILFANDKIDEVIIKEEKLKLSPYFDEILNHHYGDDNFELIFDNSRLELIKKITDFWESEKIFYVIMGSDGIGKTTTLLYFISFIHDYQIFYLNLKLFYERPKEEVENIFFEELKRVFFIDKNNYSTSLINYKYNSYRDLKSSILKNLKDSNISGIEFMWELLKEFILHFRVYGVFNSSTLLIIDQYKNDKIDDEAPVKVGSLPLSFHCPPKK